MLETLNIQLFTAINSLAGKYPLLDSIALIGSDYLPIVFIMYLIHLWFFKSHNFKSIVLMCGYTTVLALTLSFIIGSLYYHDRPFVLNLGTQLVLHAPDASFPSDHTILMSAIAILPFFYRETRSASYGLICLAMLGGFARVLCGVHFPFDILGSLLLSGLCASVLYCYRHKFHHINGQIINIGKVVGLTR